jgi:tetratricopeptide (TPR) repeat protein
MTERMRVGLLLAVSMLIYANTLSNSSAFDDRLYVFQNPSVTHFSVRGLLEPEKASNVLRPVTFATFALNWALGGERPFGYDLFKYPCGPVHASWPTGSGPAEFQTAVAIYPDFPEAISNYGLVEFCLGHDQKAKMLFERVLSLNAKGTVDYNNIELNSAGLLMKLGENDQAPKILDPLIEEWPGFSPARSDRAIIRYQRGDVAGARSDAEMALRADPSNTQALNLLNKLNLTIKGGTGGQ